MQAVESLVNLLQLQMSTHQSVDRQFSLSVQLDIAGQIACRDATPHVASLYSSLLGNQADLWESESVIWRRQSSSDRYSTASRDFVGKIHCSYGPCHLEGELNAAFGGLLDLADRIGGTGVVG
jgi:hypothetical protein